MKKILFLLVTFVFLSGVFVLKAQTTKRDCTIKYNLFKGDFQTKKYDEAYKNWMFLMDSCPKLSVNIYKLGDDIAKYRFSQASDKAAALSLVKRVYKQRLECFPTQNTAKVHSDYADFLAKNDLASEEEIFVILEKAYAIDPTKMGVKNIYRYFQGITKRYKDSDPQKVFETYDDVVEAVEKKIDAYKKKLVHLLKEAEEKGDGMSKSAKRKLNAYKVNSKALGQIEDGLDRIIFNLSTCDRLVPLYTQDFEENKTNAKWLSRAVSRMFKKECTKEDLYDQLVEAWVKADPSPKTTVYYAGILYKKGEIAKAMEYYEKAVEQESDLEKKAENLYKIAQLFAKRGQKSKARNYANQALKNNPHMGKAYLLIASLYASSANSCGNSEFEKRMVYTAALKKAERAIAVDPSIASKASKYMKNYRSQEPSKKLLFRETIKPGTSYTVKCWIGETVEVSAK